MSLFSSLSTYSWNGSIRNAVFQIKVFARNVEEARREVFAILDEIARSKPKLHQIDEALSLLFSKEYEDATATDTERATLLQSIEALRAEKDALYERIPADFFNGCYAVSTFDYTPDMVLDDYPNEGLTLGEFIRTAEPKCLGKVYQVSFSSCLDS